MERHRNHRFYRAQIQLNHAVIISCLPRIEFFVVLAASVNLIELFHLLICFPDRRKTGCFCCHDINTDSEIHAQVCNARSYKFHNLIFHKSGCKHFLYNSNRNVLRPDALFRLSGQVYACYLRHVNIICLFQQLFYKLRPALAHGHCAERAITGMGIRAKNHFPAASQHFPCKLVDNGLMRRNIHAAVSFGTGQPKHMVVFVNGTAYCTQAVMAVGQHIWNRELFQPGSAGRLNNSYKCDIVRSQLIEFYLKVLHISRRIMLF